MGFETLILHLQQIAPSLVKNYSVQYLSKTVCRLESNTSRLHDHMKHNLKLTSKEQWKSSRSKLWQQKQ